MSKYTFEEKLNIVSQVQDGKSIHSLWRETHIKERTILEWVRKYDLYGECGLRKRPNIVATPEFKEEVVRLIIEKSVPLYEVVLQYGVSRAALENWVRLVKTNDYSVLYQQKKRRLPLTSMGRAKKREPETELEKLQLENARLRAENALLKKVKALVEEREARERLIGRKPSKN